MIYINRYTGTGDPEFKVTTANDNGTHISFFKTRDRAERSVASAQAHGWTAIYEPTTVLEKQEIRGDRQ